ncbi:MAG: MAPEG family protein [Sinobacteraceae bacterium]|nr:MAPEG family protein [Nevskiaceae bacterium]
MYDHGLIAPIVALACWSLFVMVWLGYERVRNILRLRLKPSAGKFARDLDALMPERARQVSANYTHLMEQPTLFYAVCLSLQFIGQGNHPINIGLAWGYVATRVLHTIVHGTVNDVRLRFTLFLISSAFLIALAVHAVMAMIHLSTHIG